MYISPVIVLITEIKVFLIRMSNNVSRANFQIFYYNSDISQKRKVEENIK